MNQSRKLIVKALIGAGAIMGASALLTYLASNEIIEKEISTRIFQVIIGLMLVVTGNLMPKTLEPLTQTCGDPAKEQWLRRFSGWVFVLTGIIYTVLWIVVPLKTASFVSMLVVMAAIITVAIPFIRLITKKKAMRPTP